MKLHILDCGAMHSDKMIIVASLDDVATRNNPRREHSWVRFPVHSVLIEHPGGRLLWDTGPPRDWERRWGELAELLVYDDVSEDQYLDSRLRQLDLEPSDIDTVVLSHLHVDHAGNAKLFADAGARVIAHEKEVSFAASLHAPVESGYCRDDFAGLNFDTVSGDTELYPGITLLEVPGHTPGTLALRVDLPEAGTMLFTSDAVDCCENYGPPVVGNLINYCAGSYTQSVERIRTITDETHATVVFSHDAEQLGRLRLAPAAFYS